VVLFRRDFNLEKMMNLKLDSNRYNRLAYLITTGEWCVGDCTKMDSLGVSDIVYMDDKNEMDAKLDELGTYDE
jgi:hypothetical protein